MNNSQRYAVYHANDMLEAHLPPAMRWYADQSRYYTHVADVAAPLEEVFTLTNHIDHPWTNNPEVIWLATSRIRSTSVGDVIVSCENGRAWLVMPVGLQELPPLKGMSVGNTQTTSASPGMQLPLHAPFGLSQVANYEEISHRYFSAIPDLAQEAPLPPTLPVRQHLLTQLEGRYSVQDHLPPWWHGCKDIPRDHDLVITSDPAWWLTMVNGSGRSSHTGTGPLPDPSIIGNWYDTGVMLAVLVASGSDCWTSESLVARTTVRLIIDNTTGSGDSNDTASSVLRVVLGRVYHSELTSAYNLLVSLAALFEQHGLSWGCIARTNTAQFAQDGSLGAIAIEREAHKALGVPYWLPSDIERPALEGEAAYLESDERASAGKWTYPLCSVYACRLRRSTPVPIAQPNDHD